MYFYTMKIPENQTLIETAIATNWINEDGWLCSVSKPCELSLENLVNHYDTLAKNLPNLPVKFLVVPNFTQAVSPESRRYLSDIMPKFAQASAYITSSDMMKIGLNLFFKITHTDVPMRVFTDEEKAIEWLKDFKG